MAIQINKIAAKPKLIPIELDDEDTIKEYGESVIFHTLDRQPLDVFMRLASAQDADQGQMIDIVRTLLLDENGKQVITGDVMLPTKVLIRAVAKIVETLGK